MCIQHPADCSCLNGCRASLYSTERSNSTRKSRSAPVVALPMLVATFEMVSCDFPSSSQPNRSMRVTASKKKSRSGEALSTFSLPKASTGTWLNVFSSASSPKLRVAPKSPRCASPKVSMKMFGDLISQCANCNECMCVKAPCSCLPSRRACDSVRHGMCCIVTGYSGMRMPCLVPSLPFSSYSWMGPARLGGAPRWDSVFHTLASWAAAWSMAGTFSSMGLPCKKAYDNEDLVTTLGRKSPLMMSPCCCWRFNLVEDPGKRAALLKSSMACSRVPTASMWFGKWATALFSTLSLTGGSRKLTNRSYEPT
mmetsp:Transcript_34720/g.77199  ORF Transcript_34720/g.77199 Transcript_34720/m.77199 type:complete len:310 (+) Transcript_34720:827-1756(+)